MEKGPSLTEPNKRYAAVEWARQCFCGNEIATEPPKEADFKCQHKCKGNDKQFCGGSSAMNVFERVTFQAPVKLEKVDSWEKVGCFMEPKKGRALAGERTASDDMTVNKCLDQCKSTGFPYAGLE